MLGELGRHPLGDRGWYLDLQ